MHILHGGQKMAKAKKEAVISEYRIFYNHFGSGRKKIARTVGYIKSISPKKALASFLQGEGECLVKSALQNDSIREILKAQKRRSNFTIFIWVENEKGQKIEAVVGHIHAYSELQAISGFKKNQGRNKAPGILQVAILHDNLHAKLT